MQRKLFVSHSTKTPANLALLKGVCTGLASKGFEILVDRGGQLYAGLDWDLRLNEWMAECHAAVILFSSAALRDSDWVKKESAILSWRRELQEDFVLIPVLLNDVRPEDLERDFFGVLRIRKDQCVRSAVGVAQIVEAASNGLGPTGKVSMTPFERLEGVLTTIFEEQAKAKTLEDSWNALPGACKPPWRPSAGERFASAFARFLLRDCQEWKDHLWTVLDKIRPRVSKDSAEELLKYLSCLWVDAKAAAGISAAARSGGAVGLNGDFLSAFTAERYLERAWPLSDSWRLIPTDTTQRTQDAILSCIRETYRPRGAGKLSDDIIDNYIRRLDMPVVVLLPGTGEDTQMPDQRLLANLRKHFPKLIFLIGTGPDEPPYVPEWIEMLKPLLDLAVEAKQYLCLNEIRNLVNEKLYESKAS